MFESASGVVLRTRLLTETSLIVHWMTRELGRITTVAKGARGPKSPFRGKLDLFYFADFTFSRSRRSDLHTLREVELRETNRSFRRDLACLRQACYCAALIEQTTETETPLPALFNLLSGLLRHLSGQRPRTQTIFAFELKLLNELGLKPNLTTTRLSPGTKQLVKALVELDWSGVARLRLSPAQGAELQQFLHGFLIFHLGKIPRGRAAALP